MDSSDVFLGWVADREPERQGGIVERDRCRHHLRPSLSLDALPPPPPHSVGGEEIR